MSLCRVSTPAGERNLKVVSFSTGVAGRLSSAQVRDMLVHFPIKYSQPTLTLEVVCRDSTELQGLQDLIRSSHKRLLQNGAASLFKFWWPERGMQNWTGIPLGCTAGDRRFNIAPKLSLQFLLVDSLLSQRTMDSSWGTAFDAIFGTEITVGGGAAGGLLDPVITDLTRELLPPSTGPVISFPRVTSPLDMLR